MERDDKDPSNIEKNSSIDIGMLNTILSTDRTLMGWIRTSLSMFSFGFATYKILVEFQTSGSALRSDNTPRNVGMSLAIFGTLAIILGTIEYIRTLNQVRAFTPVRLVRTPLIVAVFMCLAGVTLSVGILMRAF
jgi:putative membrane protein